MERDSNWISSRNSTHRDCNSNIQTSHLTTPTTSRYFHMNRIIKFLYYDDMMICKYKLLENEARDMNNGIPESNHSLFN